MGIEPTSEAWEASILPLYDARSGLLMAIIHNWDKPRKDPKSIYSREWRGIDNLIDHRSRIGCS